VIVDRAATHAKPKSSGPAPSQPAEQRARNICMIRNLGLTPRLYADARSAR